MLEKENKLRARFVKDFKLPIKTIREVDCNGKKVDSFLYFIEKLDPYYQTKEKYNLFLDFIKNFNDVEDFFSYNKNIIDSVKSDIYNNSDFQRLKSHDMSQYKDVFDSSKIEKKPYLMEENDGEDFFSIDIKQANFQSLKFFNNDIFKGAESFQDLLRLYTKEDYLLKSKSVRQVIFGDAKINPKRQQRIQKYIMSHILRVLFEEKFVDKDAVIQTTSDEVIIAKKFLKKDYSDVFSYLPEEISKVKFHENNFSLEYIPTKRSFKENIFISHADGKQSIKNCPAKYVAEIITYLDNGRNVDLYHKNIHFLDRVVFENNRIYSFLDFIFE